MYHQMFTASFVRSRRIHHVLLAFFVILGLLLGVTSGRVSGTSYISLMRSHDFAAVSIVSLIIAFLPFLISALAVCCVHRYMLYAVVIVKAFFFGFSWICCFTAFHGAGWLIFSLLFFSDICLLPMLCWFAYQCLESGMRRIKRNILLCTMASFTVGGLDFYIISPFLAELI